MLKQFTIASIFTAFALISVSLIAQSHDPRFQNRRYGTVTHIDTTIVHDPVLIRQDSVYYLFATGWGIDVFSSDDMTMWRREKSVFPQAPQWAMDTIPNFKGHIWAPDILFHNGLYYLFYSVSAFGKNTSAIGVATNKTLHPSSPSFEWIDHGPVIHSVPGITNWNAIDPSVVADKKGDLWMFFGSFWDGIQLAKLSKDGFAVEPNKEITTIATRKSNPLIEGNLPAVGNNPPDAGGNAIEAPFLFKKGKYYYLFISIDYCCKGLDSNYKIAVGRSKNIEGPYIDKSGVPMNRGGGTIIRQGDKNYSAIGHNATVTFNNVHYIIAHGYSKTLNGRSTLIIERLKWEKGWPVVVSNNSTGNK
ncbi:MAG: family 43 glycosylhydrolase [Breznakibacter sp.]